MDQNLEVHCKHCGGVLSVSLRHCPTCNEDGGYPNVRRCTLDCNKEALEKRYNASKDKGNTKKLLELEKLIINNSGVVVSMPATTARSLFDKPGTIYSNYEILVGESKRTPAAFPDDSKRSAVAGFLFGSYAKHIRYGVLSLTDEGLPAYGPVNVRLRDIAIEKRASFLEENSYKFVETHKLGFGSDIPLGYVSCWEDRHKLVVAKLQDQITDGQGEKEWQGMLITTSGDRKSDDFVEVHIFDGFDRNAIKSLSAGGKLNFQERLDYKIALSRFEEMRGKGK